jgi:hypothetical protein
MRQAGFIEPILCRPIEAGKYEIIGGHRRTKAAALAGLAEVSAVVKAMTDQEALLVMVLDNLNREGFLCWEEGAGYADLMTSGYTIAQVAAKAGKSPSFVAGRIAIHEKAGPRARELHLAKLIGVGVLDLAVTLPDRDLAPVVCPRCKVVCGEGTLTCPACQQDLSQVWRCSSGNPQAVFVDLCARKGATNGAAGEILDRVKESYGLADTPVQTSMGFSTVQVSEAAVKVKTQLERRLGEVGDLGTWFLKNVEALGEYTLDQREAVAAQCAVAIGVFQRIAEAAKPADGQGAMAL